VAAWLVHADRVTGRQPREVFLSDRVHSGSPPANRGADDVDPAWLGSIPVIGKSLVGRSGDPSGRDRGFSSL
jgi:hypothetical protein